MSETVIFSGKNISDVYRDIESEVRRYCRAYPVEFGRAKGSYLYDRLGRPYLDFLSGCGSLNYGHNCEPIRESLMEYILSDGVAMSMDMHSVAKTGFLTALRDAILVPRQLDFHVQFTGPTGANAVEAAIKLARKFTGRANVIAFTNGFHGCSLGALGLTGNSSHRASSKPLLTQVTHLPYCDYFGPTVDTAAQIEKLLLDSSSGIDAPAAFVFETVQGEGGANVCSPIWAQRMQRLAHEIGALTIVDDIQAGCGRTGNFFSFEDLGIVPDIVIMAKSISGFGLPMSIAFIRPQYDIWNPGEHNGTFRGNNHAFITAAAALKRYWSNDRFAKEVKEKATLARGVVETVAEQYGLSVKGKGLLLGLDFSNTQDCAAVKEACFQDGLIIETCGPKDEVLKILPPLTISRSEFDDGLQIVRSALNKVHSSSRRLATGATAA
ncbi:diaminobutyrate--2-oxoglutarate transaminase [Rhizobium mongolense]|uniref:diaminobutyrate--2-oxoglutarate transaminase n=1 Tax=Rhizobium mongolense TaxID=57676 RepID=UPI0034A1E78C